MKKRIPVAVAFIAVNVLFGLAVYWWKSQAPPAKNLVTMKNTALAYLENGQPVEAIEQFESLNTQAPELKLPVRNLAVARVMRYLQLDRNLDAEEAANAYQQADAAIKKLISGEPENADAYILASRLASAAGDTAKSLSYLEEARKRRPDDAAIWFDTYNTAQLLDTPEAKELAAKSLSRCSELAPDNTFVILDWLLQQAIANDPEISRALQHAQKLLAPLEAEVQLRVRVSLKELLQKAEAGAKEGDWNAARRFVRMVGNVARPAAIVQSDLQSMIRHELEFVDVDFPEEFYIANKLDRAVAGDAIEVKFDEDASTAGLNLGNCTDVVAADYDLDGTLEIIAIYGETLAVLDREKLSGPWKIALELEIPPGLTRILAADLDADAATVEEGPEHSVQQTADVDLVLYGPAGVTVFENQLQDGARKFAAVKQAEVDQNMPPVTAAALCDLDHDGDLDVILFADKPRVLSNVDGLHFTWWPDDAILDVPDKLPSATSITVVDWDRDIDSDVLIAGDGAYLLENLRQGLLRYRLLKADDPSLNQAKSLAILDVDANASWDVLSQSSKGLTVSMTQTPAPGKVTWLRQAAVGLEDVSAKEFNRIQLLDYDNDGLEDVLAQATDRLLLLRNKGNGSFAHGPEIAAVKAINALRTADIDADGDLDILAATPSGLRIFINQGGNQNSWLNVSLLAAQVKGDAAESSGRVNQYGIGSLLEVRAGAFYQPRTVTESVTHIGLGKRSQADALRIIWTNGIPDNHIAPEAEKLLYERQSLKGSCPYLYTWDGEKFVFMTDLLWAAPIGLVAADNQLVPARPWEWLKVPGEMLQLRDGKYELQITEELWEAAYFDQVELIAIDHPIGVDIFTNEKVGPPSMAAPMIHQVAKPLKPVSARDSAGRDILKQIESIDDVYARPFSSKRLQGYTQPHYIELDFGEVVSPGQPSPESITLFLTGWVYPTDTSINAQIASNPALPAPRPPFLLTPDENGVWREVQDFTGFPGGKTKTIATDVSKAFTGNDYRLRLATSMELYWDAAFLKVGDQDVKIVQQPTRLLSADLHYRGFSKVIDHPGNGPQRYDYAQVNTHPVWPPMQGGFTRYGDVHELIKDEDDRLVILGAGDEMTLRFAAPEKPCPKGWQRDFVLHNVGYDKDADLNTVYGQTVSPLPFRSMKGYPYVEDPPAVLIRDMQKFHTRTQSQSRFRNLLRARE